MSERSERALGTVYLVGAGPGDPELLTVKAARLLESAELALYDRLVDPAIVAMLPVSCERVYVGKECGKHTMTQEEINALLCESASRYRVVVRLKGGDPLLFGRGGEEALALAAHGVPFEIVPGISSAMGVPAYAGIPLTHRGISSLCTVISGHPSKEPTPIPWASLNHGGTLVFLMGVKRRQEIARQLLAHGRPGTDPAAFVERGTTPQQRVWVGTLQQVADDPPDVSAPSAFVIGEVVRLREGMRWFL